jgi:hypothetical protein
VLKAAPAGSYTGVMKSDVDQIAEKYENYTSFDKIAMANENVIHAQEAVNSSL